MRETTEAASSPQVPIWGTAGASGLSSALVLSAEARSLKTRWWRISSSRMRALK